MEGIQVSIDKLGLASDTFLIKVGGYVDTTTSQELDRALEDLLKKDIIRLIIDLEDVDYISSAGWGIFISEIKTIRKKGGDIKLARMTPDVFEVFELLEFHRILKCYDSVDEAIKDFELESGGRDRVEAKEEDDVESVPVEDHDSSSEVQLAGDVRTLSLEEKIKRIVRKNPEFGTADIRRQLMSEQYGPLRVGSFQIYRLLRKLDLNSMKKRVIFSRSK